ncbi:oligosaccharide flippase family protein [Candidatus Bathyarchaeota archaeon]|nr:oligosaccharide flippase family protein [Candidatus Bathyarchaeota archaeon]
MADSSVNIMRGASLLVLETSFSAFIGIFAFALISRLISRSEMGMMTVLLLLSSTLQLVSSLGLPNAATKFIAEAIAVKNIAAAAAVASKVIKTTLAAASISSTLCFAFSGILSDLLLGTSQHYLLFQVLALNIFFASLVPVLTGVLLGMKCLREIAIFGVVSFSLQQMLVVLLLLCHYGLFGVVVGWVVGNLFNFIASALLITRSLNLSEAERLDPRALLSYSWPLYPVAFVSLLDNWFDRVLFIGHSLSELGIYNVAYKAFGYFYSIPIVVSDALFPHFSELRSREGLDRLSSAFKSTSRYLTLIATPLALGVAALAWPLITLFAGRGYASAAQPLSVLCVFSTVSSIGLVLGKILLVLGETRGYSLIIFSTVLAGMAVGKLLVPLLGPLGASFARAASMLLALVPMLVVTSRKIKIRIDGEALWKSWTAGVAMSATLFLLRCVSDDVLLLPAYVAIGAVTYMLMLRSLHAVTEKDLEFVRRLLGLRLGESTSSLLRRVLMP